MAQIITDYDLSTGTEQTSTAVTDPNNVHIAWEIDSATDESQVVELDVHVVVDGETTHIMKVNPKEQAIIKAVGNVTDSRNFALVNAATLTVVVPAQSGLDGTLNVWALNS